MIHHCCCNSHFSSPPGTSLYLHPLKSQTLKCKFCWIFLFIQLSILGYLLSAGKMILMHPNWNSWLLIVNNKQILCTFKQICICKFVAHFLVPLPKKYNKRRKKMMQIICLSLLADSIDIILFVHTFPIKCQSSRVFSS